MIQQENSRVDSRLKRTFAALAARKRKGLIPFFTAGDPSPALTVPLMHALVANGADILELGIPFSDPMAEGPVIQRACERALRFGVTMRDVLGYVESFRQTDSVTPVVLMGYANPIERMGHAAFIEAASKAGVDGTIVVDYPPEECEQFSSSMQAAGLDVIFLLAPTSTPERIRQVARVGTGFSYYVSLKGVTGAANIDITHVESRIADIRRHVHLPIGVGFGIRDAATARAVATVADAVVIGSRIIEAMEQAPLQEAIAVASDFIASIRRGLDE